MKQEYEQAKLEILFLEDTDVMTASKDGVNDKYELPFVPGQYYSP